MALYYCFAMQASSQYGFYSAFALLAMHSAVIDRGMTSVRPSVRQSVTFRYCVQTNEDTIVRFSASGSTIPLVYGEIKFIRIFAGITPCGAVASIYLQRWGHPFPFPPLALPSPFPPSLFLPFPSLSLSSPFLPPLSSPFPFPYSRLGERLSSPSGSGGLRQSPAAKRILVNFGSKLPHFMRLITVRVTVFTSYST